MTGYGKGEYNADVCLTVEIKTVNNRNFDFNAKLPRAFIMFEDLLRKTVSEYVKRARVDLFVTFMDKRDKDCDLSVDLNKARAYVKASEKIAEEFGLDNDFTVSSVMKSPDVLIDNSLFNAEEFEDILKETTRAACENLNKMRRVEGEKLVSDMLSRMDVIEDLRKKIIERAPLVAKEYKEKLKARIEEALADVKYDEARLLSEVAFFTDKANIDEELTRLGSHVSQFREIVITEGAGKKLDFLMQEFKRETNTICSKSNDIEITGFALLLKNEIEKVREQVQNLE